MQTLAVSQLNFHFMLNYRVGFNISVCGVHGVLPVTNAKFLRVATVKVFFPLQHNRVPGYVYDSEFTWLLRLICQFKNKFEIDFD